MGRRSGCGTRAVSQLKSGIAREQGRHRTYSDTGLLHPSNCRIDVRDVLATPRVSGLLGGVPLAVLVPRVVDQRDA